MSSNMHTVRLPEELTARLATLARATKRTKSYFIREALDRSIEDLEDAYLAEKYDLTIVCFGLAGDGNIHTNIMLDRKDESERRRAGKAVEELFGIVLGLGGTISGEHGIGIAKSPFIELEVGGGGLDAMRRIKQALDPLNIMNPGKMFVPDRTFLEGSFV